MAVFQDLRGTLLTSQKGSQDELYLPLLLMYLEIAPTSPDNLEAIVSEFFNLASARSTKHLAQAVVARLATQLRYNSTKELFEDYFPTLIPRWLIRLGPNNVQLEKFPVELFACYDLAHFLQNYGPHLLPYVVLLRDTTLFEQIASHLQKPPTTLLKENWAGIYAAYAPLKFSDPERLAEVEDQFVLKYFTDSTITSTVAKHLDEILVRTFHAVSVEEEPTPPLYTTTVLSQFLDNLRPRGIVTLICEP